MLLYSDVRSLKPGEDSRPAGREIELHITGNMDRYMWGFVGKKFSEAKQSIQFYHGEWRTGGERRGEAEVQALYSRLIARFWNLQAGLRYDQFSGAGFNRSRGFAVIGLQGLARYRFELEPALFISQDGDVSARLNATYDLLVTQRLILQPRLDFDAAVQSAKKFGGGERRQHRWAGLATAL